MSKPPDTRPFDPKCACGKDGTYGYGCNLLKGIEGHWLCSDCAPDSMKKGTPNADANPVNANPQRNG
jgi:hypothetical protein